MAQLVVCWPVTWLCSLQGWLVTARGGNSRDIHMYYLQILIFIKKEKVAKEKGKKK
jgi:hypothetical protein